MVEVQEQFRIETDRLILRLFEMADAEAVATLCNNYNLSKNTLYLPYPYTLQDALQWIERHEKNFLTDRCYEFAITDKESGEVYGAIALSNNPAFEQGEIAYWIGEPHWGKGYATEAAQAVVRFAFEHKKMHKVFARYFSSNPASGKVMEKIGMQKEGVLKDHLKKDEEFKDVVYYGIIREDTI